MKTKRTLIITGNHHTPAIELINLLREDNQFDWQIHYIGHLSEQDTHLSHTIIPKLKIPFYNLNSGKFNRKDIFLTIISIPKIVNSFFKSLNLIEQIKPDLVISFGGYVSVPVIIASFFKHIPSITHEQTRTTSLATRINSFFVKYVALSFDKPHKSNKEIVTGNLIRQAIFDQSSPKFKNFKLKIKNLPIIYITGGNQGSEFINNLISELLPKLTKFSIIHQTGNKNISDTDYPNYHHYEYIEIEDIGWVLNNADIVISRSGANICQELNILHQKSILIPLPFTQQDEQVLNAQWLKSNNPDTTIVLSQDTANSSSLLQAISSLHQKTNHLNTHHPHTTHPLVKLIYEIIN